MNWRILLSAATLLLALGLGLGWWGFAPQTPPPGSTLAIPPGSALTKVADQLQQRRIIRSALAFRLFARLKGEDGAIQAGSYSFSTAATPAEILERLVRGDVDQISLTIPEGFNLHQIADRLAADGITSRNSFLAAAQDPALCRELGLEASSLEGYLYPETYRFVPGIGDKDLLRMMVGEFRRSYARLRTELGSPPSLPLAHLVTLASIIQKETGLEAEMPLISSVFHNRLRLGIPLQTDPTVIYAIEDFNGNLTREDLQRPSPYNTYLNRGLPPGPIANPGYQALLAASRPAKSNFLYFVARGDGSHQFSATLREHNRAVRKFQLHRDR